MEAKYRNKKFCSDRCRVYFGRENPKIIVDEPLKEETKNEIIEEKEVKPPIGKLPMKERIAFEMQQFLQSKNK